MVSCLLLFIFFLGFWVVGCFLFVCCFFPVFRISWASRAELLPKVLSSVESPLFFQCQWNVLVFFFFKNECPSLLNVESCHLKMNSSRSPPYTVKVVRFKCVNSNFQFCSKIEQIHYYFFHALEFEASRMFHISSLGLFS